MAVAAAGPLPTAQTPSSPTLRFPLTFRRARPVPAVFAALRHRNFRLFIIGQFISLCGTWIQKVAQGWLVLQLTDSAFAVGLVTALGSLPILLFTLYGGVVADRVNKRPLHPAAPVRSCWSRRSTLGILTALDLITVHWVMGLAVFSGLAQRVRGADPAGVHRRDRGPDRT